MLGIYFIFVVEPFGNKLGGCISMVRSSSRDVCAPFIFLKLLSLRRHRKSLRKYVQGGTNGSVATRVLTLLAESGIIYMCLLVCYT